MKKIVNGIINLIYSLVSFLYFLLQNGTIIIPNTTEMNGYILSYTKSFEKIMSISGIVLAVVGIGIIVFDFILQKNYAGMVKAGLIASLCICIFTVMCILFVGKVPVTSALGIVAALMIVLPSKRVSQ